MTTHSVVGCLRLDLSLGSGTNSLSSLGGRMILPFSQSALGTTITVERLIKRGYEFMSSYYEKVSPDLNEPLYA
jgi:hypothetical protein